MSAADLMLIAASAGVGFLAGIAYFAALNRTVALYLTGTSRWRSVGAHLLRIAAVLTFFSLIVQLGAQPLLAAFAGLLIARPVAMRVLRPPL